VTATGYQKAALVRNERTSVTPEKSWENGDI
jgi:hypothetical protein